MTAGQDLPELPRSHTSYRPTRLPLPPGALPLTPRESLVLSAVAGGRTTDEISQWLAMTPQCVRLRLSRAATKIGDVPGRGHLVHRALAYRHIPLPSPEPGTLQLPVDQWTVLHCIAAGMSTRQIARQTPWPVRRAGILTGRLLAALDARTPPHAVHRAWAIGLLGSHPAPAA